MYKNIKNVNKCHDISTGLQIDIDHAIKITPEYLFFLVPHQSLWTGY